MLNAPEGLANLEALADGMSDTGLVTLPTQFVRDLVAYVRALEADAWVLKAQARKTVYASEEAGSFW